MTSTYGVTVHALRFVKCRRHALPHAEVLGVGEFRSPLQHRRTGAYSAPMAGSAAGCSLGSARHGLIITRWSICDMGRSKTNRKWPVYLTAKQLHALHHDRTHSDGYQGAMDAVSKAYRAMVKDEADRKQAAIEREIPLKMCPACFAIVERTDTVCHNCHEAL